MISKIFTHNGVFHGDEVMAIAILETLCKQTIEVVRTRNPKVWETRNPESEYLIDVGGEHLPTANAFDHHQEADMERASAGLVWQEFGTLLCTRLFEGDEGCLGEKLSGRVYDSLIRGIDLADTGRMEPTEAYTVSQCISSFNNENIFSPDQDIAFRKAVDFAKGVFERELRKQKKTVDDEVVTENAFKVHGDVAYFPRFLAGWKTWVLSHMDTDGVKEKKFVAYPSGKGESWKLQAMPNPANPTPSSIHTIIPTSLETLPYVVFIHKAGFIAEVTTRGDITNLVAKILG